MRKIYKYTLKQKLGQQTVYTGGSPKLLDVQFQGNDLCAWAEVEVEVESCAELKIWIAYTGYESPPVTCKYLKTILIDGGSIVLHVYEVGGSQNA